MTTVCVLRSGGDFDARWVHALRRGVADHLPGARFLCLSDVDVPGVETVPLLHDWPGWWSKVEVFRPGLMEGRVLYLDLDTLPVGDLSFLGAYAGTLAVLSDFYRPHETASGVMLFDGRDPPPVYDAFRKDPGRAMQRHGRSDHWYRAVWGKPDRVQDLWPGRVVSLKAHAKGGIPPGAALVCGHGKPRFSSPSAGWAHNHWSARAA